MDERTKQAIASGYVTQRMIGATLGLHRSTTCTLLKGQTPVAMTTASGKGRPARLYPRSVLVDLMRHRSMPLPIETPPQEPTP